MVGCFTVRVIDGDLDVRLDRDAAELVDVGEEEKHERCHHYPLRCRIDSCERQPPRYVVLHANVHNTVPHQGRIYS